MIRAFIAIKLPRELKETLVGEIDSIGPLLSDVRVRWVRRETMHLTLKFLDDISNEQRYSVEEVLQQITPDHLAFELTLGNLGCFPNPNKPRVIWVGVQDTDQKLQNLQKEIDVALEMVGIEKDKRPFKPHLTLGRIKNGQSGGYGKEIQAAIEKVGQDPIGTFKVGEVVLFRSELEPSGAVHTELGRYPLGKES